MSTQPIIINIQDQIDPSISAKINGIAVASRDAALQVNNLQVALAGLSSTTLTSALSSQASALSKITVASQAAAPNIVNLGAALGQIKTATQAAIPAGATLAHAINLITPPAQQSNSQLVNMAHALLLIQPAANATGVALNTMSGRLANLLSRVVGAQLGIGRLGGAIGGLLTQIIAIGPLLLALLAVAAVAGAFLLYEKFRKEANELADTQAALGKEAGSLNDKLLQQKERIAELTAGPMARYAQALKDIRRETTEVDFSTILKELEEQHSYWARIDAAVERVVANVIKYSTLKFFTPPNTQAFVDIRDTELWIRQLKAAQEQGTLTEQVTKDNLNQIVSDAKDAGNRMNFDRQSQLERALVAEKKHIDDLKAATADQVGTQYNITWASINALQQVYDRDLAAYTEYQNKKTIATGEAAAAAREEQLRLFNEEMQRFKAANQFVTAQDELRLRQQQLTGAPRPTAIPGLDSLAALAGPSGGNIRKLKDDIAQLEVVITRQDDAVTNSIDKYKESIKQSGAYSDALKEQIDKERLLLEWRGKGIPINDRRSQQAADAVRGVEEEKRVGAELTAIYKEFLSPLEKYDATLEATNRLLAANKIGEDEATIARRRAARELADATDPLNEYNIGLQHQMGLMKEYGDQLVIDTEIDRVRQDLQRQGRDLTDEQAEGYRIQLREMRQMQQVQSELNNLWEGSIGAQQKLVNQQTALNRAVHDGVISLEQYKNASIQVRLSQIELQNAQGKGGLKSAVVEIFGSMVDLSKTTTQKMIKVWQDFFGTLKKGFADSLAHALVFGGSLKQGLLDVARNVVVALISSFIQLGIELLIIDGLSHLPGIKKLFDLMKAGQQDTKAQAAQLGLAIASIATITAVQLAAINALMGPAWSLAEAVSLFSFGANAAPAAAGIAAVVAAGAVIQGAGKFAGGGLITGPGGPTDDRIPIMASPGEYVVNAGATARNYEFLQAINSGGQAVRANSTHVTNNVQMKINVLHDGSTNVNVEQLDENTVRIIARREAKTTVQDYAPDVIATDLHNPNSRTSKAVARNVVAPRRR